MAYYYADMCPSSNVDNMETPRPPQKRTPNTGRFPVKPSVSGIEEFARPQPVTAGQQVIGKPAPPIPARSNLRNQLLSGERYRSHSESVAQRNDVFKRQRSDLPTLEEDDSGRRSSAHLRGLSHGSAIISAKPKRPADLKIPLTAAPSLTSQRHTRIVRSPLHATCLLPLSLSGYKVVADKT